MSNIASRIGTVANLAPGATYDLLLIQFPGGFPQSQLVFNIDETPRKVTGIQKVAQTFLKILWTTAGSNVLFPAQGTRFSQLTIGANILTDDATFISDLNEQVKLAESQTKAILNTRGDPEGQLQTITVLGLDTDKESATLYLRLLTKAGAQAQVAVPFPELELRITEGA